MNLTYKSLRRTEFLRRWTTATLALTAKGLTTSLFLSTIVFGQEVVLKDGKRLNGSVQKYENGLAYILLIGGGVKPVFTTLSEDLVDKVSTDAAEGNRDVPTNTRMARGASNTEISASSTPGSGLSVGGAQAQIPSRAALLQAERRAEVEVVEPPKRTSTEKGLSNFAKFSRFTALSWNGFQFAGGDFPSGAGFNFGIGFRDNAVGSVYEDPDLPNRVDVSLVAAASTSSYYQLSGDFAFRNLGGSPFSAGVRAEYYEWPQMDFYGLGLNTQEDDRTSYLLRSTEIGGDFWLEPTDWLRVGGGVTYLKPTIGSGRDGRFPSAEELFDAATIPGFEIQPDFLRLDGFVAFDWRDRPLLPRSGGYYGVRISTFKDQDFDSFDFRRYEVDLQQYIPWRRKYSVLALRALTVLTDADTGNEVPFYYMPTLGGGDRLRGFREGRFTDRNSLLLTAEYRWEAWWPLDMALFVDVGRVAFERSDLLEDLEASYGIGFRFHSTEAVAFRLDLAFSREGFIPLLRYTHVF